MITQVTDATLDKFLSRHQNVVVDLWAPWCRYCLEMEPRISDLSEEFRGIVAFGKLNTDENPKTARKFRVRVWPTLLAFNDNVVVGKMTGAGTKSELKKFITRALVPLRKSTR